MNIEALKQHNQELQTKLDEVERSLTCAALNANRAIQALKAIWPNDITHKEAQRVFDALAAICGDPDDWSDAPEWAQYKALDVSGRWVYFENEPTWCDYDRCWNHYTGKSWPQYSVRERVAELSLRQRPTT